jgi:hypothetical protein
LDPANTAPQRRAALRLLSHIATAESQSTLLLALSEADCPEETIRAIGRLASVEQLVALARNGDWPQRQRVWLAAILQRKTPDAVAAYLELAADAATSTAVIQAARGVKDAPVDELFAALTNPRVATRVAAAEVLGAVDDPNVSKRLAKMALANVGRREALLALLASSNPVAREFLAYAYDDSSLGPTVKALSSRFGLN